MDLSKMLRVPRAVPKWRPFKSYPNATHPRWLPPEKKWVLVRIGQTMQGLPDPVCVGYLKYHAGVKTEPYFVTPGFTMGTGDGRVLEWCDCLPDDFKWPA